MGGKLCIGPGGRPARPPAHWLIYGKHCVRTGLGWLLRRSQILMTGSVITWTRVARCVTGQESSHRAASWNPRVVSGPEKKHQISRQRTQTLAMQQWQSSLAVTSAASCPAKAEPSPICTYCKEGHAVSSCPAFAALPVSSERAAVVRQYGLCWACLCHGHVARRCSSRQRCAAAPDCAG